MEVMNDDEACSAAERLRLAFDMHDFGVRLMRENLRRRYPQGTDTELDRRLTTWLRDKPFHEPPELKVTWFVKPDEA